jgi:hypothetical protein
MLTVLLGFRTVPCVQLAGLQKIGFSLQSGSGKMKQVFKINSSRQVHHYTEIYYNYLSLTLWLAAPSGCVTKMLFNNDKV